MGNAQGKLEVIESLEDKQKEIKSEVTSSGEKKLKPCCACPETKKARDACIMENGEENCGPLIEAHKACMRNMGFNV
ncbi:cytochrome c oxidase copper chaperone [Prorops nasuta]|uniref:cytochrome c oxidase copper chaperone n=1 Tax=Prorops nasuta TaxID=863751 RepID=UPI0034CE5DEE